MAAIIPQDVAQAIKYGPQTQQAIRRSSYLADALKSLNEQSAQPIRSYGELGAKLLAEAILQRKLDKAQSATLGALKSDQDRETASILAGFQTPPSPAAMAPPSQPQPAPQPESVAPPSTPNIQPQSGLIVPTTMPHVDPQALDLLTRMGLSEAGGEGPDGMAAAMHVARNRLVSGYGGAKSMRDVILAPHQFEGMTSSRAAVSPSDPAYQNAQQVALKVMLGEAPDPTGGAIHFINPELQTQLGRQMPQWALGKGLRIGRHVFFGGSDKEPPSAPADAAPAPFQLAANGAMQPGMIPSAPPSGGAEAAPAANGPQAAAAGVQHLMPNSEELAYLEQLLRDPQTHDAGVMYGMRLRQRSAEALKQNVQTINGVPFLVNEYTGDMRSLGAPKEAQTQLLTPQQAGVAAPPGTAFTRDPTGNLKEVHTPQSGEMVVSGPGAVYREAPIPGGTQDPRSPSNIVGNERQLREEYAPALKAYTEARNGYEKVLSAARDNTGASDIALIFGFMKTLDPTSTVREGEFATAQNSGSIDQTLMNLYNRALKGERLQPEQRAQFAKTAESQFGVAQQRFDQMNQRFSSLATSYGFDPSHVIQTFEPPKASAMPPPPNPEVVDKSGNAPGWSGKLPPAQLQSAMRFKGSNAPPGSPQNPLLAPLDPGEVKRNPKAFPPGASIILPDGSIGSVPRQ